MAANLFDLFSKIAERSQRGTVEVKATINGDFKKIFFYFSNGQIIFIQVDSPENNKLLGQILIENDFISQKQLDESLKIQKNNPEKFLGDILVQKNYINQVSLIQLFRFKIQYLLFLIKISNIEKIDFLEEDLPERTPEMPFSITIKTILKIQTSIDRVIENISSRTDSLIYNMTDTTSSPNFLNDVEERIFNIIKNKQLNLIELINEVTFTSPLNILNTIDTFCERNFIKFIKKTTEDRKNHELTNEKKQKKEQVDSTKKEDVPNILLTKIKSFTENIFPYMVYLLIFLYFIANILTKNILISKKFISKIYEDNLRYNQTIEQLKFLKNFPQIKQKRYLIDIWQNKIIIEKNIILSKGPDGKENTSDDISIKR